MIKNLYIHKKKKTCKIVFSKLLLSDTYTFIRIPREREAEILTTIIYRTTLFLCSIFANIVRTSFFFFFFIFLSAFCPLQIHFTKKRAGMAKLKHFTRKLWQARLKKRRYWSFQLIRSQKKKKKLERNFTLNAVNLGNGNSLSQDIYYQDIYLYTFLRGGRDKIVLFL